MPTPPQPPLFTVRHTIVLAVVLAVCAGVYAGLFLADVNTTGGAPGDLAEFHLVSIQIYREAPFFTAMRTQYSAMGPLYYAAMAGLEATPPLVRLLSAVAHFAGAALLILAHLILWANRARPAGDGDVGGDVGNNTVEGTIMAPAQASPPTFPPAGLLLLVLVYMFNPFILGPAIWGNPEGLAFLMLGGAACLLVWRADSPAVLGLAGLCLALAVLTRQSHFALLPLYVVLALSSIRERGGEKSGGEGSGSERSGDGLDRTGLMKAALFCAPSIAAGLFMLGVWGGLTPPEFTQYFTQNQGPRASNAFLPLAYLGMVLSVPVAVWLGQALTGWGGGSDRRSDRTRGALSALFQDRQAALVALVLAIALALGAAAALAMTGLPVKGGGLVTRLYPVAGPAGLALLCALGAFVFLRYFAFSALHGAAFLFFLASFVMTGDILYQKYFDPYLALFLTLTPFFVQLAGARPAQYRFLAVCGYLLALLLFAALYFGR